MDILEVKTIETLLVVEGAKELLESSTSEVILEKTPEILVETLSVTNILEVGIQGPPGPPGSGGLGVVLSLLSFQTMLLLILMLV